MIELVKGVLPRVLSIEVERERRDGRETILVLLLTLAV